MPSATSVCSPPHAERASVKIADLFLLHCRPNAALPVLLLTYRPALMASPPAIFADDAHTHESRRHAAHRRAASMVSSPRHDGRAMLHQAADIIKARKLRDIAAGAAAERCHGAPKAT